MKRIQLYRDAAAVTLDKGIERSQENHASGGVGCKRNLLTILSSVSYCRNSLTEVRGQERHFGLASRAENNGGDRGTLIQRGEIRILEHGEEWWCP